MWEWDPVTPKWTPITDDQDRHRLRRPTTTAALVYDPVRAQIVLFGGYSGSTRELWELDGTATDVGQPVDPDQRSDPAPVPVAGLRQQARQGDAVRRLQQRRRPRTSRTPGSGRAPTRPGCTAHQREHQAARALAGRDGLRQQARPAAALGRLRHRRHERPLVLVADDAQLDDGAGQRHARRAAPRHCRCSTTRSATSSCSTSTTTRTTSSTSRTSTWTNRYDSKNPPPAAFSAAATPRSRTTPTAARCCSSPATAPGRRDDLRLRRRRLGVGRDHERLHGAHDRRRPDRIPVGRNNHVVSYDSARRVVVMFGGYGAGHRRRPAR